MISASFVPEVGPWAEDKLECLREYLSAYTTILRKQRFKGYVYVDAFAGAGTAKIRRKKAGDADNQAFLSALGLGEDQGQELWKLNIRSPIMFLSNSMKKDARNSTSYSSTMAHRATSKFTIKTATNISASL